MNKNKLFHFDIEKKAGSFRQENGFSATEPIHLSSLLIKRNVITLFKPLSGKLAGMAIKADEYRFMMVNQNHSLGKQHFTIGHELYHLFVQENFTSQRCVTGLFNSQVDIEEKKADAFSANLLLPELGIMQLIPSNELGKRDLISDETLFKIQQYYNVSMRAVIYRLCELEIVDNSYFDKYATGVKSTAKRLGYDVAIYKQGNTEKIIGDYGTVANQLFQKNKISESHYFELMNSINVDPLAPPEYEDE
jgi:Zn-dependent peptidase ImmA (M78 family)